MRRDTLRLLCSKTTFSESSRTFGENAWFIAHTLDVGRSLLRLEHRCASGSPCAHVSEYPSGEDVRMRRVVSAVGIGLLMMAVVGCGAAGDAAGGPGAGANPAAPASPTVASTTHPVAGGAVSLSALPLGDGKVDTTPNVGYVDACQTTFGGGGAQVNGPWIHGSTWDAITKIAVQGSVRWPQARNHIAVTGDQRIITTDDLPEGFTTGTFPIASTDPAFAYDRNPNTIRPQSLTYTLPANPTLASTPSCANMGPVGVLADGVVLYNALDGEGRDAVAHEVLDGCGGHPDQSGTYHHHDIPPCLLRTATGSSTLVGYALDGFGIYVERDAQGNLLTNADLDACHGRTSVIAWDGKQVSMYHYVATAEYPYDIGCYRGAPMHISR
jgi:hypothetical protein